jgi:putative ubiquitin-RnfH superfamily antitoxin RatB of RatAB toxin-antitoxin module
MVLVELIYIPAEGSVVHLHLSLEPGATVADVLETSGILKTNPEVKGLPVGIFSKQVTLHSQVKSGDRVEIYRPLTHDPKEKRRQRAKVK